MLRFKLFRYITIPLLAIVLSGCEYRIEHGGYIAPDIDTKKIELGQSSEDILGYLGSPSIVEKTKNKKFFYISSNFETAPSTKDELLQRIILVLQFDKEDKLASIRIKTNKDAIEVDSIDRQTPSIGNNNNLLEQIFSRFGRGVPGSNNSQATNVLP